MSDPLPTPSEVASETRKPSWLWVKWQRARLYVGTWIIGDGLLSYFAWQRMVMDRTRDAIHEDGRVDLANCELVADALYGATPGNWELSMTKVTS